MKNLVRKVFRRDGTAGAQFVVPAGVTKLRAIFQETFDDLGFYPTHGIDQFGDVWSWGSGGTVGDATITTRYSPVSIDFWTGPMRRPFLRTDGQMVNWGSNAYGQVGNGTSVTQSIPVVVSGGHTFKKVFRGFTCYGLTEAGELYAWGRNHVGQLGDGTTIDQSTPVLIMSGTTFTDFWPDSQTDAPLGCFAKDVDGNIYGWGQDSTGSLGNGAVGSQSTPTLVLGAIPFVKVERCGRASGGTQFAAGLTATGDMYSWGLNTNGQLGHNTIVSTSSPVLVVGGYQFQDIMVGLDYAMGLTKQGTLYAWGTNTAGQLAQGNIFPKSSPVTVSGALNVIKAYAAGQSGYAITADKKLYAWGHQETLYPVLGTNDIAKKSVPTLVFSIGVLGIIETLIKPLNGERVAAITRNHLRYAWGDNTGGYLGVNSVTARFSAPQQVVTTAFSGPSITGNIWWKRPDNTSQVKEVEVTPGQTINVVFNNGPITVPELGLIASNFSDELELQWVG